MYIGNVQVCPRSKKRKKKTKRKKKKRRLKENIQSCNNSQKGKREHNQSDGNFCCNLHLIIETFWLNFRRK